MSNITVPVNQSDIRLEISQSVEEIQKANQAAIDLIDHWMADESGYDESVWPQVEQVLEKHPLSFQEPISK